MTTAQKEAHISHPDKVLFPESNITKQELADYYAKAAPYMLPHIHNRAITLQRFPDGIGKQGFYQKEASDYFPDYIKRIRIKLKHVGTHNYILIENADTLTYLCNIGNIPIHAWLSRKGGINNPDMVIWDLDPSDGDFEKVRQAAWLFKEKLESLDILPFLKTTGSRGLHIVVPIQPAHNFTAVRNFARKISEEMAQKHPDLITVETSIAARGDRIFADYLRNGFAQTAVAPYSVRAKEDAPVAVPVEWKMLKKKDFHAQYYNIKNVFRRLKSKGDIWQDMYARPYDLSRLIKKKV